MPVRPTPASDESLRLLADAGTLLSSTLDTRQLLENLAHLVVPRLADWCIVDIADENEVIQRVAVVCDDITQEPLAESLRGTELRNPDPTRGVPLVMNTGRSLFHPTVDLSRIEEMIVATDLQQVYREIGLKSLMIVPINAKGQICGAIHFGTCTEGERYTASDLLIAEDLGRRLGLAIDNARHFEESNRIAAELKVANEAKDEFLGLISHELRTPITVIHGGARVLRMRGEKLDDATRQELIADIEEESDRLHRVVENLLVLSRAELKTHFEPEPILLHRVAREMAAVFSRHRRQRQVIIECDDNIPPVAADQGFVEQLLRNLLSNADKYSPEQEPIELTVRVQGKSVVTTVSDRGPGVSADEVERIFDRFFRGASTQKIASGAGMGLAVCKRLVEAMSGTIRAENREGGGLTVTFTVPLYGSEE
jgi:signal transduction histidine kinase